ncbi:MAG: sensor domain-containing protein [Rhodococcus sp. (in: high G+C Gram-positive bacteria)]|uniref:sensor domain-containing protein n=1 Tax=Rhodococcus sp. TaxID=1831 RepID=UPI003BB7368F
MLPALLVVSACATTVSGVPTPHGTAIDGLAAATTVTPPSRPLAELLLPVEEFPEPYVAVVLPPQAVAQAAPDLTGIPVGAKVDPAGCLPPTQDYGPDGTAMAVGTDNDRRATISVELVSGAASLGDLRTRLADCPNVEASHRGATATVTTVPESAPSPPAPGVDTLELSRTVRSGQGGDAVTQAMRTRIAQIGDLRVLVTYMSFGSGDPDLDALGIVYDAAVARILGG